jgi:hypothetical protein
VPLNFEVPREVIMLAICPKTNLPQVVAAVVAQNEGDTRWNYF